MFIRRERAQSTAGMSKAERITYLAFVGLGLFFFFRYLLWWFQPSHLPENPSLGNFYFVNIFLFSVLSYVVFFPSFLKLGTWLSMWFIKKHEDLIPPKGYKVAFVTCFVPGKEPIEMLKETLIAMKAVDYDHDTWVLDEGDSEDVKKICKELEVNHFSRFGKAHYNQSEGHFKSKTKAGNLNSWRVEFEHNYDFIAQVDMDHVPKKDYLTKQLGQFIDPKVGYVVAPQIYKNTENWIARGAAEQTHFYYGPHQRGFSGVGMPFLIGTTHIYRVKAIQDFGGYAPSISEDYLTSMHFSSHGWKGVYVPEIVAEGLGPTSWSDYLNQQSRWSFGLYHILFTHLKKHFFKLTFFQKTNLFFSQIFYFSGLTTVLGFVLTIIYLLTGINSTNMTINEWALYAIPAYLSSILVLIFLHRFYLKPKEEPIIGVRGMLLGQAASIIYTVSLLRFIFGGKLTYVVTSKTGESESWTPFKSLTPHIAILVVSILALTVSLITGHNSLIMRFWAVLNIFFLSTLLIAIYWQNLLNSISKITLSKPLNRPVFKLAILSLCVILFISIPIFVFINTQKASQVQKTSSQQAKAIKQSREIKPIPTVAKIYSEQASHGDSKTTLSRKIIKNYCSDNNLTLTSKQLTIAEATIAQTLPQERIYKGTEVNVNSADLAVVINPLL